MRKQVDLVPLVIRVSLLVAALALLVGVLPRTSHIPRTAYGPILHEEVSEFSQIRVRGTDTRRSLLFVTESGTEQLQSSIDLTRPGELQVAYARALFASVLFGHPGKRVLVVGLGGGGMVRYLATHSPDTEIEVVEIDPAVVRIAADWFETREEGKVRIHTEDAFTFFPRDSTSRYDAIYFDAFLRPDTDRDPDGSIARMKSVAFLETIRATLTPRGILAVNLVRYRETTPGDLSALSRVFPSVFAWEVAGTGNLATFASQQVHSPVDLRDTALSLDETGSFPGIRFAPIAREMRRVRPATDSTPP